MRRKSKKKNYQDEDKKSAINEKKKLILRLRSLISKQDLAFLSEVAVNHLKKAIGAIWPKRSEKKQQKKKKNYQYEDKKSAIKKN